MNKVGVSPLASTVILLVFATGLGAIVMSWGSSYAQIEAKEICSKTSIEIMDINLKPHACLSQGVLYYTIQNTGETNIYNYKITLLGSNEIQNIEIDNEVPVGEIINGNQAYNVIKIGHINKLIFMPRLDAGSILSCPKSSAAIDNVEVCEE